MELRVGQVGAERFGRLSRRLGLARLSAARAPGDNVRVALLHEVDPRDRRRLRDHLERLLERRRALTPDELLGIWTDSAPQRPRGPGLAISFDDGLVSSFEAVEEVLDPLGLKAAFFVPTAILELRSEDEMRDFCIHRVRASAEPTPARYRVMSRAQLLELQSRGHSVFAHTHTHMPLAAIDSPALVERELRAPRAILEDLLQSPAAALALPFGDDRSVGPAGYRAVEQLYDVCFTSIPGVNLARSDRLRLHRDGFDPGDSPDHVDSLAGGALDLPYRVKMWRLRRRSGRPAAR